MIKDLLILTPLISGFPPSPRSQRQPPLPLLLARTLSNRLSFVHVNHMSLLIRGNSAPWLKSLKVVSEAYLAQAGHRHLGG